VTIGTNIPIVTVQSQTDTATMVFASCMTLMHG
jgi:hypothetical protein